MNITKKGLIVKITAIFIIITMIIADFIVIGKQSISYAIDLFATNNDNVQFVAYFINSKKEESTNIDCSINNNEEIKLKLKVDVKNQGYFKGQISIEDANFKVKEEYNSPYINKIENNVIYLNQINAGTTADIELDFECISSEEINIQDLTKESKISLIGTYVDSKKETEIKGNSNVVVNWKSPENITAKIDSKILTNSVYKIGEENKRVVQILVGSKIEDNVYPIKNTKIEMLVPDGVEEVVVHKRTTSATNGNDEFTASNYQYNAETGSLTIDISNNEDKNGKIDWVKNAQDIFVITYKYPETIDVTNQEITINGTITTYDGKELKEQTKATIQEKVDGIVTNSLLTTKEIYKGNMYISKEKDYKTITTIYVDYTDAVENIQIKENKPSFVAGNEEKVANIQYKKTEINRNEFTKIFGENGYITIQDQNGNVVANLTKDSQANEDGNIIINYTSGVTELTIKTSVPITNGILNIEHTKTILSTGYSREEIRKLTGVKDSTSVTYTKEPETEITQSPKSSDRIEQTREIKLAETQTMATITSSKDTLSANSEENQLLKMQIVLDSNKETQDLYKNPTIKLTFPNEISLDAANISLLYGNGLKIADRAIKNENGKQVLTISLEGEQTSYSEEAEKGTTLLVDLMTKTNKLTTTRKEDIIVNYTNENATSYVNNGEEKVSIQIINEDALITINNIVDYGLETIGVQEQKEKQIEMGKAQDITIDMKVINNEGSKISDVAILGKMPTISQGNTSAKLISGLNITSKTEDVAIYYTDVENPSKDLTNTENKWKKEQDEYSKNYLILVEDMEQGEELAINYKINMLAQDYDLKLEESYSVSYTNTLSNANKTENATKIILTTSDVSEVEEEITAKVGKDLLLSGAEVKAGEIIDYTITLKNNGDTDITGVNVKANIPDGTTYIEYNEEYINNPEEIGGAQYRPLYTENAGLKEKVFSNVTIPAGKSITLNYSIRINEQITDGTKVTTTAEVTNDFVNLSEKIDHTLKNADIVTSISRPLGNNKKQLAVGSTYTYTLNIKNISNVEKQNIKVAIDNNELLTIDSIRYIEKGEGKDTSDSEFVIGSLASGEEMDIDIYVIVSQPTEDLKTTAISAVLTDGENKIYRTNEIKEEVEKVGVALEQTSNIDEKYVEPGENISYTVTIENTGKTDMKNLYIKDKFLAEYLELQSITLNGKEATYDIDEMKISDKKYSFIEIKTPLKVGEKATIIVNAKVKEDLSTENEIEVANLVEAYNEYLIAEQEIKNYMKATENDNADDNNSDEKNNNSSDNNNSDDENNQNNNENNQGNNSSNNDNNQNNDNSQDNEQERREYSISGIAWLDSNENGIKDSSEIALENIDVMLLDITNNKIAQDVNKVNICAKTDSKGEYTLANIPEGKYMVVFEYDTGKYMITAYQVEGTNAKKNSDAINKKLSINGEEKTIAATDTINITKNMENIDLGLVEARIFDLELDKYVSKIVVSNVQGTSTYNFDDETLAKVEIGAKYLSGSSVVIEYKIKVTNKGEVAGYAKDIVDYFPSGLTFSSSLNKDWYQSGNYIYNSSLANTKIEPGETKELTLVATKTMTESNTGLVNNKAEIQTAYNSSGIQDTDSTPGNQDQKEDDLGSADVIILVKTGGAIMYVSLVILIMALIGIVAYIVNKKLLAKKI